MSQTSTPCAVLVIGGGTVTALAGGLISLADLGVRTTRRASHLEFNDATNEWDVLTPDRKLTLYSHADYDNALAWERDLFNRMLAGETPTPGVSLPVAAIS